MAKLRGLDVSTIWWEGNTGPERYDFASLFGNDHPVELDLGCGKGLFLYNQARLRPGVNFIGIDWSRSFSRMGAERILRHGINNVRIVADDSWTLFPRFNPGSMSAIHVYFPDPWWKTRHRKRRMIRPEFIGVCERLIPIGGLLSVATDVGDYFKVMEQVLGQATILRRLPDIDPDVDLRSDYLTHFERKYRLEGRSIWRARFERI
ncbi:tRNA (guanosine(46)-N7)-methyltransferase TrmB [bacterium]|nr:tRNA (guanosine(46)-N7)-methyltransferase TrmB [bacterium]